MRSFLQKIFLLLLTTTGHELIAQVRFTASLSANAIGKNEVVQLKLTVENAKEVQQITPPDLKNFIILSGPNQESGMSMINGDVKQFISLNFILQPKGPGNYSIGAATATADGKELRSNSVKIRVSNTVTPNAAGGNSFNAPFGGMNPFADMAPESALRDNVLKKGESAAEKVSRNMFVKLELDKKSCYVGEPVIATYKLYTRLKSESNLVKNPSFNGFSVIDLQQPDNLNYKIEKVNGREYNVYVIRKAQLYPLQAGNLELDPVEIENNVFFIKEEYVRRQDNTINDVIRDFDESNIPASGTENHKVTLKSEPATVLVKALPIVGVPTSFNSAVGKFSVTASLEKDNFSTDDAGKLKVMISGAGNLQLVNTPEIQWPQGFEPFEPATTDDFVKTAVPVSGKKLIDYPFTVSVTGSYVLPPVKFSYFDPQEGKYKTDSTQPLSFTVTKGSGEKASPAIEGKKENDSLLNTFISNRRWVISTIAVLIIIGLLFWLKKDTKKEARHKEEQAKAAKLKAEQQQAIDAAIVEETNWLEKAATLLHDDSSTFYKELNVALKTYLSKKLQLPVATINRRNINEALDKKNIPVDISIQLQQVMNAIEQQLYTPFPEKEKIQELYTSADDIICLLDTYKI